VTETRAAVVRNPDARSFDRIDGGNGSVNTSIAALNKLHETCQWRPTPKKFRNGFPVWKLHRPDALHWKSSTQALQLSARAARLCNSLNGRCSGRSGRLHPLFIRSATSPHLFIHPMFLEEGRAEKVPERQSSYKVTQM
jgi:hypothetical protein